MAQGIPRPPRLRFFRAPAVEGAGVVFGVRHAPVHKDELSCLGTEVSPG